MSYRKYLPLILMVGSMSIAIPRYIGIFANQESLKLNSPAFVTITYLSGIGMALLEGIAIWYAWSAWSESKRDTTERKVLLALICLIFASIAVMVTPYVYCASLGTTVANVLPPAALWLWSLATAVSSPLVMAATGLADRVAKGDEPVQASPAEQAWLVSDNEDGSVKLIAPVDTDAKPDLLELIKANPKKSQSWLAQQLGVSRQRVGQRVAVLRKEGLLPAQ